MSEAKGYSGDHFLFGPRYARVPGLPAFELALRSPGFGCGQLAVACLMLDWRTVGSSMMAISTVFRRFTSSRGRAAGLIGSAGHNRCGCRSRTR